MAHPVTILEGKLFALVRQYGSESEPVLLVRDLLDFYLEEDCSLCPPLLRRPPRPLLYGPSDGLGEPGEQLWRQARALLDTRHRLS